MNNQVISYADLFLRQRDSPRILLTADESSLSYANCVALGERLARALLAAGIERPARIATVLPNSIEFAIVLCACARLGITLVPISTWSKAAELTRILRDARAELVVAKEAFADHGIISALHGVRAAEPDLRNLRVIEWGSAAFNDFQALAARCSEAQWNAATSVSQADADLAILYTSGSTGLPKGVILKQSGVAQNAVAIAARMGFSATDRVFSYFPFFFSGGLCNSFSGALSCGAELVTQAKFEPASALALIRARQCTGRNLWRDGLAPLAAVPGFQPSDIAHMKRGLLLDPDFIRSLGLPPDESVNMYGMTETATAFTMGDFRESLEFRQKTYGTPFPGTDLRICRHDSASPVAVATEGEICVRGFNLMRGYTDGSESALIDEDGFFHSGDNGYTDASGHLHFTGRKKTMIKIKGLTVQPEEVEATLLRHADVAKVVVVGEGESHDSTGVVALVVLRAGTADKEQELQDYCRQQLSSYKVPRVVAIEEGRFPLSINLKIDRPRAASLLRELGSNASPDK